MGDARAGQDLAARASAKGAQQSDEYAGYSDIVVRQVFLVLARRARETPIESLDGAQQRLDDIERLRWDQVGGAHIEVALDALSSHLVARVVEYERRGGTQQPIDRPSIIFSIKRKSKLRKIEIMDKCEK